MHEQLQLMQREADKPEGAEEAAEEQAEEAEAPAGEGDDEAQYEITQGARRRTRRCDLPRSPPYLPVSP